MVSIVPIRENFHKRLNEFIEQYKLNKGLIHIGYEIGTKYAKVTSGKFPNSEVLYFINFSGDIHRALGWKNASKDVISSIYDDDYGIEKLK